MAIIQLSVTSRKPKSIYGTPRPKTEMTAGVAVAARVISLERACSLFLHFSPMPTDEAAESIRRNQYTTLFLQKFLLEDIFSPVQLPDEMKLKSRLLFTGAILISILLFYVIVLLVNDLDLMTEYKDPRPLQVKRHNLCIVVPYRDRFEELREFSPHMSKFLDNQNISYHILIMNQTDSLRFNRASLINIGWNEADRLGCDYMAMNDVDLLPVNPEIPYGFPGFGVIRHITSPQYHPKYHYEQFIGGILMLTLKDYKILNGMSNKYWGWGLEDDEFYLRIVDSKLNLTRVSGLSTNSSNTFRHIHGPQRKRDYIPKKKDRKQWEIKRKRDNVSGLHDVRYVVESRQLLLLSGYSVTIINVALHCDLNWTPYCKS